MKRLLILLLAGLLTTAAYAGELVVIKLKHRSAEELIPVIRPLLDKDEMVSGMNYQLILRASTRNIAQIRRLLDGIDTVPRRLKITVMQDVDSDTAARLVEISGSAGPGNARITAGGDQGQVQSVNVISTRSLDDDKNTQQLQVLEGNRARVASGQNVPILQRVQTTQGAEVIETTQYRDVASGFYVLPRIHGDTVTLEISAQNDSSVPNQSNYPATRIQNISSIVSGRLGEWIIVGGLGQQNSTDKSTISTRSISRSNEQRAVLIKVEEVN